MKKLPSFQSILFFSLTLVLVRIGSSADIPWELEQGIVRLTLPEVDVKAVNQAGFKGVTLEATVVDGAGKPVPNAGSESSWFQMDYSRWESADENLQEDLLWVVRSAVPLEKRGDLKIRTLITFDRGLIAPAVQVRRDFSVLNATLGDPLSLLKEVTISLSQVKEALSSYSHALVFVKAEGETIWSAPKAVDLQKNGSSANTHFTLPPSVDGEGVGKYDVRIQMIGEEAKPVRWEYEDVAETVFTPKPKKG